MKTIIKVRINDRDFNMACDEGQEDRLRELGQEVDLRIKDIKSKVGGQINESMLFVMASIMLADELSELKDGSASPAAIPAAEKEAQTEGEPVIGFSQEEVDHQIANELEQVAERLEKLAA